VGAQSALSSTWPSGASQASTLAVASPYPSPSVSAYQVASPAAPASSVSPSQSLSMPSQVSVAASFTAGSVSSQSLASAR